MNYGLAHRYYARQLGQNPLDIFKPGAPVDYTSQFPATSGPNAPFYLRRPATVKDSTPAPTLYQQIHSSEPAICLDQQQNSIPCADPNCTYGDCGSAAPQITVGSLCLDQQQNQIACSDPNCTYGDCVGTSLWSKASIIPPIPDVAIYAGLALIGASLLFAGRR